MDLDLSRVYPDTAGTPCTVRWRPTESTAAWSETTVTGFRFSDVQIKRLYSMGSNGLFVLAGNYGPIFNFQPTTGSVRILGRPLLNPYDACFAGNKIYVSGYTATTLSYDPSLPWSLYENTTDRFSLQTNPRVLPLQMGKYHYYTAIGADGTVFAAAEHLRDSTGGELGWFEPRSGTFGRIRTPFEASGPRHMLSAVGGTRILYAEDGPSVHILDAAAKSIVATLAPLFNIKVDKMVDVGNGCVVGASERKVFKLDVLEQKTVWVRDLPGDAFGGSVTRSYDRRLVFGPDKHVWLFAGNLLCRLAPDSGNITAVLSAVAGHLTFHNTDLYIFDEMSLRKIQGLLVDLRPQSVRGTQLVLPR